MNNEEIIRLYIDEIVKKSDELERSLFLQRKHIEKYIDEIR